MITQKAKKLSLPSRERVGVRGYDEQTLSRAHALRKQPTSAETMIWQMVRNRQLQGYKFRRQQPVGIFIVDFLCPEKNLIIEIDGDTHGSQNSYDENRTHTLNHIGYKVIRFWNDEVMQNPEGVFLKIAAALNSPPLTPPSRGGE